MKFSYNWLRELVDGLDTSPAEARAPDHPQNRRMRRRRSTTATDSVIEVDNKSLTHRPDLWGHHGMAREVAAIPGKKLIDPVKPRDLDGRRYSRRYGRYALCPRYSALVFRKRHREAVARVAAERLEAVGLNRHQQHRRRDQLRDGGNRAADARVRCGQASTEIRIFVRSARAGETFAALNGESYTLDPSNLVIAERGGPLRIAGIIGGAGSAISDSTTRIVLESANFNAVQHSQNFFETEAPHRRFHAFRKSAGPGRTPSAAWSARWSCSNKFLPESVWWADWRMHIGPFPRRRRLLLPLDWLDRKLGRAIPAGGSARAILEVARIQGRGDRPARTFSVFVPSWRATKDISIKEDLVEEVGRMIGYDSIPPVAPLAPARVPPSNPEREFHHRVREMAAAQGFTEVHNYSFISEEMARAFSRRSCRRMCRSSNPIAADQNLLRPSLLPGIWKNINDNARHFDQFRLFEIGRADSSGPRGAASRRRYVIPKKRAYAGLL